MLVFLQKALCKLRKGQLDLFRHNTHKLQYNISYNCWFKLFHNRIPVGPQTFRYFFSIMRNRKIIVLSIFIDRDHSDSFFRVITAQYLLQLYSLLNFRVCKSALIKILTLHQIKNLNLLFSTQNRHTRGWGQIINPTHIVMLFFWKVLFYGSEDSV